MSRPCGGPRISRRGLGASTPVRASAGGRKPTRSTSPLVRTSPAPWAQFQKSPLAKHRAKRLSRPTCGGLRTASCCSRAKRRLANQEILITDRRSRSTRSGCSSRSRSECLPSSHPKAVDRSAGGNWPASQTALGPWCQAFSSALSTPTYPWIALQ